MIFRNFSITNDRCFHKDYFVNKYFGVMLIISLWKIVNEMMKKREKPVIFTFIPKALYNARKHCLACVHVYTLRQRMGNWKFE